MSAVTSILPLVEWRRTPVAIRPLVRSAEAPLRVNLVRRLAKRGQRDRFICDLAAWDLMLEVAISFGWKQRGTTYAVAGFPAANNHVAADSVTRHNYQPGDSRDPKCVESVDAIAWAAALSAANRSPHLAGMLEATLTTASARSAVRWATVHSSPFDIVMSRFTAYAFGGEFEFARAEAH
jgi:hypothetical protein